MSSLPPIPADGYVEPLAYTLTPGAVTTLSAAGTVFPLTRSIPQHRVPSLVSEVSAALRQAADDGAPAWFVFPATVSGGVHDDGRCVGIALAPRRGADPDALDAELTSASAVVEDVIAARASAQGRAVVAPRALDPDHWTGPSAVWFSATPLRGFPDERVVRHAMAAELGEQFGVGMVSLTVRRSPQHSYEVRWPNGDLADGLGQWWCEVVLTASISGPLVLGPGRDHGFGLFQPERTVS